MEVSLEFRLNDTKLFLTHLLFIEKPIFGKIYILNFFSRLEN